MSFLRRGQRRRGRVATVLTTVGAIAAFQALAIVGAGSALALSQCTYNPATDTINITVDPGQTASVAVETTAANLDAESPAGAILFTSSDTGGGLFDYENGVSSTACGSASNSNTVAIVVLGQPSNNEGFVIDEAAGGTFNTAIAWNLDLGTNTVGGTDALAFFPNCDQDNALTLTNSSFDLNGGVGEVLGAEHYFVSSDFYGVGPTCDGAETVDASAVTFVVGIFTGPGVDTISPGTASDTVNGGGDCGDTLSYSTRTTATVVDASLGVAGFDANGNGAIDGAEEADSIGGFDTYITGTGADTLIGSGANETFVPGDGDDSVDGNGGVFDTLDYSTSSAAMVIDFPNGTATGQGADKFADVEQFVGSDFDDTLLVNDDAPASPESFSGGAGTDLVDASAATSGVEIDLDELEELWVCGSFQDQDDLENATGSAFDDELFGSEERNTLDGGAGDDFLSGREGNDTLIGGVGNDEFNGGSGADTVSFKTNTSAGVNVDLSLGFATSAESGDDAFDDLVEIIVGSPFNDTITGGPFAGGGTVNFLFKGLGGKDKLTGFNGNDTLKGGGGKDIVRGVGGDDSLYGGGANDRLFGGGGTDFGNGGKGKDVCKGVEIRQSCGSQRHPASPQTSVTARRQV